MALESKEIVRVFKYNSVDLQDPGLNLYPTAESVRDFYAATYPEIVSAGIDGPEEKEGKQVYTFRKAVGTKGTENLLIKKYREMTIAELFDHARQDPDPVCGFVMGTGWRDAEGTILVIKGRKHAQAITEMLARDGLINLARRVGP